MKRLATVLLLSTGLLVADGGTVQFRKQAGPFEITLFSTPHQLRIGNADLSVMVQTAAGESPILDADVTVHLTKQTGGTITEVVAPLTHAHATDKLLYAAQVNLPSTGSWRVDVQVKQGMKSADVSGRLEVLPPQPPLLMYWPYFALVPLVALLFAANKWLRRNRQARP